MQCRFYVNNALNIIIKRQSMIANNHLKKYVVLLLGIIIPTVCLAQSNKLNLSQIMLI